MCLTALWLRWNAFIALRFDCILPTYLVLLFSLQFGLLFILSTWYSVFFVECRYIIIYVWNATPENEATKIWTFFRLKAVNVRWNLAVTTRRKLLQRQMCIGFSDRPSSVYLMGLRGKCWLKLSCNSCCNCFSCRAHVQNLKRPRAAVPVVCGFYPGFRHVVSTSTSFDVHRPAAGAVLPVVNDRLEGVPDRWRTYLEWSSLWRYVSSVVGRAAVGVEDKLFRRCYNAAWLLPSFLL